MLPAAILAMCTCLLAPPAKAETLADAIALAYQSNPTLQSARAQLRALDESYVQARAGLRPTAEVQVAPTYQRAQQTNILGQLTDQATNSSAATVQLNQPLYTGGAATWTIEAASDDIRAARESLRSTEAQVLQNVVQAYVDVRRDQKIVTAYVSEVGILQSQLDDVTARKAAGDVTRTDVEQSQTQLDSSRAALTLAEGQLQVSRSEYFVVVGQNPGTLAPEPPLPGLPTSIDEAYASAQTDNPVLLQTEQTERADRARIDEAKAQFGPTVALSTSYGYTGPVEPFAIKNEHRSLTVGVLLTVPLLTGGVAASNVRKATEIDNSDRLNIESARRSVVQTVSNAWNLAIANRASALSDDHAVDAARKYFSDTEKEYRVAQRSTLDVLIAEQTLRSAEIASAQAEHDCYLAQAELLAAVGRLEAADLVADVPIYDPAAAFRKVWRKGAMPWEDAVAELDRLGAPGVAQPRPLSAPAVAKEPALRSGPQIPDSVPLATNRPIEPITNTTSPATPPGLGVDRGEPYTPSP